MLYVISSAFCGLGVCDMIYVKWNLVICFSSPACSTSTVVQRPDTQSMHRLRICSAMSTDSAVY
jgi:hypothetical protein